MGKIEPKVSVIVPVYNVEQYLVQCIESIRNQTYRNIEIILVNDGSIDESGEICKKYLEVDTRIRVINQKNLGVAVARNTGIRNATGTYVVFVDADDWLDIDAIQSMRLEMGNADIITNGFWKYSEGRETQIFDLFPAGEYQTIEQRTEFYHNMLYTYGNVFNDTLASIWNKMFRLDIIEQFYEELNEQLHYEEDALFVYTYLFRCNSIIVSKKAYYHYRMREGSAIHSICHFFLKEVNEIYLYLEKLFFQYSMKDKLIFQLQKWITELVFYGLNEKMGFMEEVKVPIYLIPSVTMLKGKKVALYGAGKIGKEYVRSLKKEKIEVVVWVDNAWKSLQNIGLEVQPVEYLLKYAFDYILIAVKEETMMRSIKESLEHMGIEKEKIVWNVPRMILD